MGSYVEVSNLAIFADIDTETAEAMISDVEARAAMVAPCLVDADRLTPTQRTAVLSVLRRVILRWHESGNSGSRTQRSESAGPFSHSETVETAGPRGLFWPSEVADLQTICKMLDDRQSSRAFNIDQGLGAYSNHQPWCSITWGIRCSCGANLTRGEYPLWEGGLLS